MIMLYIYISIIKLLLQAGANPALTNKDGLTFTDLLRQKNPAQYPATFAFLDEAADAEKATFVIKTRRLVANAFSDASAPSYLQCRVAQGQPLPIVELAGSTGDNERAKKRRLLPAVLTSRRRSPSGGRAQALHFDGFSYGAGGGGRQRCDYERHAMREREEGGREGGREGSKKTVARGQSDLCLLMYQRKLARVHYQ